MKNKRRQIFSLLLAIVLLLGTIQVPFTAKAEEDTKSGATDAGTVLAASLRRLAETVTAPVFGTTAGDWSVLCLARGGYYERDAAYFAEYYERVVKTVAELAASVNLNGALHRTKSTENSRLILALSAIGKDAHNVGGVDLVAPYEDMSWLQKQGITGPVYALLALDSRGYQTKDETIREQCVEFLLGKQLADGGWALSGASSDPDMTAMTLQALAPYTEDEAVALACEQGIAVLSSLQCEDGGYASWGVANAESIAQVIVACTAHGINPHTDSRFVKNGHSAVDALLGFYLPEAASFSHGIGQGANGMATDQAVYALVAYNRFLQEKPALYDMRDESDNASKQPALDVPKKAEDNQNTEMHDESNRYTGCAWLLVLLVAGIAFVLIRKKICTRR